MYTRSEYLVTTESEEVPPPKYPYTDSVKGAQESTDRGSKGQKWKNLSNK